MSIKRVLMAAMAGMLALPATAFAVPDYPPSGAAVEIEGDLVTGATIEVRVRNCRLGEVVRTSIESMPPVDAMCESPITSFAGEPAANGPRPGLSAHQVRLPSAPGVLEGRAELLDSDETLTFFLDVREDDPVAPTVAATPPPPGGMSGWPFLIFALLIGVGAVAIVALRRRTETP